MNYYNKIQKSYEMLFCFFRLCFSIIAFHALFYFKIKYMLITRTSMLTGVTRTKDINVTQHQLDLWHNGIYIQDAMPHLEISDREFIKTGITYEEWEEFFNEEY